MPATMSEPQIRSRVVLSLPDELREAMRLQAAREGLDMSDLLQRWVEAHCQESLAEVRARRERQQKRGGRG